MRYHRTLFVLTIAAIAFVACGGHTQMPPTLSAAQQVNTALALGNSVAGAKIVKKRSAQGASNAASYCVGTTCYVVPGGSVTVTSTIVPDTGFTPCGPTMTNAITYWIGPTANVSVTMQPATQQITCGVPATQTFTATVSSQAKPNTSTDTAFEPQGSYEVYLGRSSAADISYGTRYYIVIVAPPTPTPTPTAAPCAPGTPGPDPTKAILLVDANGNPITDSDGNIIFRPDDGHDPQFFINQGLVVAGLGWFAANPITNLEPLPDFVQGGPWDEQRINGTNYPEFVDYATIAIGLYGAASGTPEYVILNIENLYAWKYSHYQPIDPNTYYDTPYYPHLPRTNVSNTNLGYNLYNSKAFALCSSS